MNVEEEDLYEELEKASEEDNPYLPPDISIKVIILF